MTTTPAQEQRFRVLASRDGIAGVSRIPVGRLLALVARNSAGELVEAEVFDTDGEPVALSRACQHLAGRRRQALRDAELSMQALVAVIAANRAADELNLTAIARQADASKQTLYNRLQREPVAA